MAGIEERTKTLLCDLGKATMRGVRKCPNCGNYNGTRCVRCKNKSCGVALKLASPDNKDSLSPDAVKILTDANVSYEVYSVRLRDSGPDFRSFVQLPLLTVESNVIELHDKLNVAKCYTEMCNSLDFGQDLGTSHFLAEHCRHVKSALQCVNEAQPLSLKNSVLNSLPISSEIKQAIWMLATDSTGPSVQRVSKNTMVVKCKVTPRQPLGYVHFTCMEMTRFNKNVDHRFYCSCRSLKTDHEGTIRKREMKKRCVHFYACICAFASNEKLAEEFSYYVKMESNISPESTIESYINDASEAILTLNMNILGQSEVAVIESPARKSRNDDLDKVFDVFSSTENGKRKRNPDNKLYLKKTAGEAVLVEANVNVDFHQWLDGVIERIYELMHYQFDGNPEPLTYQIPNFFFDCLEERFSIGCKKRRLPNSTTIIARDKVPPLGSFTHYSWHFTNLLHVKQIFDTPKMQLEVIRYFTENRDGTYVAHDPPVPPPETRYYDKMKGRHQPIRPLELKTFLKVGKNGADVTPFIIEWVPNLFPKSKTGELSIKFQYGHQRNNQIESRNNIVK
ncbi:hypothetical protein CHUAL_008121 [Chamberlinius hualienensis]